jgi:hypothetical protein
MCLADSFSLLNLVQARPSGNSVSLSRQLECADVLSPLYILALILVYESLFDQHFRIALWLIIILMNLRSGSRNPMISEDILTGVKGNLSSRTKRQLNDAWLRLPEM